jgi:ATPase subunit of ABC transporter with duplicated ATPase domains
MQYKGVILASHNFSLIDQVAYAICVIKNNKLLQWDRNVRDDEKYFMSIASM